MKKNGISIIVYELIKLTFIIVLIGVTLGAIYDAYWPLHNKIIFSGFFIILCIIANEISRIFNHNDANSKFLTLSIFKITTQLELIGKKNGVKESSDEIVNKEYERIEDKINFERKLSGYSEDKIYIILIVAILFIAYLTSILI